MLWKEEKWEIIRVFVLSILFQDDEFDENEMFKTPDISVKMPITSILARNGLSGNSLTEADEAELVRDNPFFPTVIVMISWKVYLL